MRAELAGLNDCAVPFLSRAAVNWSWYCCTTSYVGWKYDLIIKKQGYPELRIYLYSAISDTISDALTFTKDRLLYITMQYGYHKGLLGNAYSITYLRLLKFVIASFVS